MENIIELHNLTKVYNDVTTVKLEKLQLKVVKYMAF
ncbi:ABC transporter domain-containing protein [Dolosigranulum pigrum]|uniref:Uncharacterized protein n=1 Tax=Dolosigranulum pigrum ATCC 51524 TaxID=883103 RepID=H3NED6_9LACT|nr:hypothetical protein HMPREF9703_00917 [Dolosigranulum pigrum ATCC 51524]